MSIFDSEAFQNGQLSGLDALQRLGKEVIEGNERLVRLQLQVLRTTSDGFFAGWRRLLSVHSAEEVSAELSPTIQTEQLLDYGQQVHELAAAGQKVFLDIARQQMDAGATRLHGMVAEVAKNAPADAEPLVTALERVAKTADCLYGQGWKAADQGVELADNVIRLSREAGRQAVKPKD